MNTFDKLFTKILLENKISNIELNELNIKNTNDLNLFLKGVNLAAIASDNDLWDNKIFQITAE